MPSADAGYAACQAATTATPAAGNVGAGAGACVGKLFGLERCMKGGIGNASVSVGLWVVGALVACNAVGDVIDPDTGHEQARSISTEWGNVPAHVSYSSTLKPLKTENSHSKSYA